MIKFLAFGLWTVLVMSYTNNPEGTASSIHSTFDLGGTLVHEATGGINGATGGGTAGAGGDGLSVPDGWQVQTLPDGRKVAIPPGYSIAP